MEGMPELLRDTEVAKMLHVSAATVRRWRAQGKGPRARKFDESKKSCVRYLPSDIEEWLRTRPAMGSTPDWLDAAMRGQDGGEVQ